MYTYGYIHRSVFYCGFFFAFLCAVFSINFFLFFRNDFRQKLNPLLLGIFFSDTMLFVNFFGFFWTKCSKYFLSIFPGLRNVLLFFLMFSERHVPDLANM